MIDIELYTFQEAEEEDPLNFFENESDLLAKLNTDPLDAWTYFQLLYNKRYTIYSAGQMQDLANLVFLENRYRYNTLADTLNLQYNPIENYNMTETGSDTRTPNLTHQNTHNTIDTRTDNLTEQYQHGHQQTLTHGTTETTINNQTETTSTQNNQTQTETRTPQNLQTAHAVAPFDKTETTLEYTDTQTGSEQTSTSYAGNPDTVEISYTGDGDTVATTGTETTANTGTDSRANTGTQQMQKTGSDTLTETGTEQTAHSLTRSGNIGVTTSQQMIESERQIANLNLLKIIFSDIAEKIFISEIY